MGDWEVGGVLEQCVIDADTFDEFTDLVTQSFFQAMDFGSRVGSAWCSFLESIDSFTVVAVQESYSCDFGVLLGDKKFCTHPFWLAVLVDVDWDFAVVVVVILLLFLLLLLLSLLSFFGVFGWWASCVEKQSQVVVAVLSHQFNLGSVVVDVPTVVVEKVNVFVGWWFVLWFVFDFFLKLFSQSVSDVWKGEQWNFVQLESLGHCRCEDFNHFSPIV